MPDPREVIARAIEDRNTLQHGLTWGDCQERADAALSALRRECLAVVPLKTLAEARAVMRACGWHLAPAADSSDDPTLALAAAEIEAAMGAILDAAQGEMVDSRQTNVDEIVRAISYEPTPEFPTHHRWWRIELAYGRPICAPSLCVQGFTFWLGEGALYA